MAHWLNSFKAPVIALVVASLCSVGCGESPAPAEKSQPATSTPPAPPTASVSPATQPSAAAEASPIPWEVPSDWERVPGDRPMRVATFRRPRIANEEIAVSQFAGEVGGVLANVNRWRAQVGLGPITEAELPQQIRPFDNGKLKGHTMRLRGEKQHMLAAIISEPAADRTWFVKAVCSPMAADTLEGNLFGFAQSFGTGKMPPASASESPPAAP